MAPGLSDRAYWVDVAQRLSMPVLGTLAERRLKQTMPVETNSGKDRGDCTHLEAFGRLLCGIAPWLELQEPAGSDEAAIHGRLCALAQEALAAATDPQSPDYLNFVSGQQPLVDAAFLAQAILRAPRVLWLDLEDRVQHNIVAALNSTHDRKPAFNNWLLFAGTVEAALCLMGEHWDRMRIDYALRQHMQWYLGDGTYGDGPHLHWDYYNSFVIQPMLVDIMTAVGDRGGWDSLRQPIFDRARRYAAVQERMIGPDGTYPPLGRSLTYRCGAFQLLAQNALRRDLPKEVSAPQIRCALTAVIRRTLEPSGTFDENGWLRIGLSGHQPRLGEGYISTGSLYLCSAALLPLGLSSDDPFWQGPAEDWTAKKLWNGEDAAADHAI